MAQSPPISVKAAREVLGVGPLSTTSDVRRAFREAAKLAHPDRPGGGETAFRRVVEAYHRLQARPTTIIQPPAPMSDAPMSDRARPPRPGVVEIDALIALDGGAVDHWLADGRRVRLHLPPGLRAGDKVRAGGEEAEVVLRGLPEMLVRGDDLWINAQVSARVLAAGGRVALETPIGRRIVWLTKKAGERKLIRLVGHGLPARGHHKQGHLFLRLAPKTGEAHSAARTLLRRFTAAWAA